MNCVVLFCKFFFTLKALSTSLFKSYCKEFFSFKEINQMQIYYFRLYQCQISIYTQFKQRFTFHIFNNNRQNINFKLYFNHLKK